LGEINVNLAALIIFRAVETLLGVICVVGTAVGVRWRSRPDLEMNKNGKLFNSSRTMQQAKRNTAGIAPDGRGGW